MTTTQITPYLRAKAEGILDAPHPGRGETWPSDGIIIDANDLESLLGLPRENALIIVAHRLRHWYQKPQPKFFQVAAGREPMARNANSDPWPHELYIGARNSCRVMVRGSRGTPSHCGEPLDWGFHPQTNELGGFCNNGHPIDVSKYHYDTGVGGYFANRNRTYAASLTTPNNGDSQ